MRNHINVDQITENIIRKIFLENGRPTGNIRNQKESRRRKLKESNTPPTLPPAQKHLELANQLLTKAIDEFHLAMDSDKSLKIFPLVMELENLETKLNNNTSKTIASWGALPGEDHRPVDTGKYNPHDIDLHHPRK